MDKSSEKRKEDAPLNETQVRKPPQAVEQVNQQDSGSKTAPEKEQKTVINKRTQSLNRSSLRRTRGLTQGSPRCRRTRRLKITVRRKKHREHHNLIVCLLTCACGLVFILFLIGLFKDNNRSVIVHVYKNTDATDGSSYKSNTSHRNEVKQEARIEQKTASQESAVKQEALVQKQEVVMNCNNESESKTLGLYDVKPEDKKVEEKPVENECCKACSERKSQEKRSKEQRRSEDKKEAKHSKQPKNNKHEHVKVKVERKVEQDVKNDKPVENQEINQNIENNINNERKLVDSNQKQKTKIHINVENGNNYGHYYGHDLDHVIRARKAQYGHNAQCTCKKYCLGGYSYAYGAPVFRFAPNRRP